MGTIAKYTLVTNGNAFAQMAFNKRRPSPRKVSCDLITSDDIIDQR